MSAANKFDSWVNKLDTKQVNLSSDVFKVMLTNTAPVRTNVNYSDISANELASGNGYTTGGLTVPNTGVTNASGTDTFVGDSVTWTATGSMGPFRYAVLYDTTATGSPLALWYDYGQSSTLNNAGETFAWKPSNQDTGGTIDTLA